MSFVLLDREERRLGDIDEHIYTTDDIMVLRQFEAAAEAKALSLFTQSAGNSYAYLLLEVQITLQRCRTRAFEMHAGKCIRFMTFSLL